ncbi:SIR2 family protein [Glaciihabitans arcticus]|uniref:SIR2 family protein n=1 Tax=Glaciihabitans arcticus TaxID=2668039 RepID=UPI001386A7E6|nr:SIR2 family protein [Glaciihabitans arcticus]
MDALVRRAAAAAGTKPGVDFDAEAWWLQHGDGAPLGYSSLLEQLGTTRAARRAILAGFFEPSDDDRDAGLKVPGPAHEAIAAMVRKGAVRVIVTTNFDRLIERALESEGISPQVITSDSAIAGMEPVQHMACTVIKLHGDYASLDQRNTVDELSQYPKRTNALLQRIFDEYGVVIAGWSGDWDPALTAALESSAGRRYPMYWSARSKLGDVARTLTARTGAQIMEGASADEFFADMLTRVEAVEAMSDSPQSLGVNISRVKRALPDPRRRIELRDLLDQQLGELRSHLADRPMAAPASDWETAETAHLDMTARSNTLANMLGTGIFLDRDQEHSDLWVHVVQSALRARRRQTGTITPWWDDLQHLPALLSLVVGSAAALAAGHEEAIIRLHTEPSWSDPFKGNDARPAFDVIHSYNVLNADVINGFPSSGTTNWLYPQSHFLKSVAMPMIESITGDPGEAEHLFNRAEYRAAVASALSSSLQCGSHSSHSLGLGPQSNSALRYSSGSE